jgi:EmrB/QacA subfamily drug resistance transporter
VGLVGLASGLTGFDETSLGVVLKTLQVEFGASMAETHWVVNAYLVVMASLVGVTGRLADKIDAVVLCCIGLAIFAATSLAAGFAPDIGWLVGLRAVQGVGAAIIWPATVVIVSANFADEERGRAFGVFSSWYTMSLLAGPVLGGVLTEYLSWRWVFWVTVPPALLCLWGLPRSGAIARPADRRLHLDVPGAATMIVAVCAMSTALMQGDDWGWTSPAVLGLVVVSVLAAVAFVHRERRAATPLIDLRLFRNAAATVSVLMLFMAQYRRVTTSIFVAVFLRSALGFSPLVAGLALIPSIVLLPFSTVVIGRLADRHGARVVMIWGVAGLTAAVAVMAAAIYLESYWVMLPALCLASAVAPAMFGPSRKAMMKALSVDLHAQASGISVTAQMLGATIAISAGSALMAVTDATWPVFVTLALLLAGLLPMVWAYIRQGAPTHDDRNIKET